jgi:hypothetical protein
MPPALVARKWLLLLIVAAVSSFPRSTLPVPGLCGADIRTAASGVRISTRARPSWVAEAKAVIALLCVVIVIAGVAVLDADDSVSVTS